MPIGFLVIARFDISLYRHAFEEHIVCAGDNSINLVVDGVEVLVGETLPPDACQAAWSRNPGLILITEEYIRHEIYLHKIVERLEETAAVSTLAEGNLARTVAGFTGHPVVALPLGVGLLMLLNRRVGMETMSKWTSDAIVRSASILLIVGAGGALGAVLQQTGVGDYLGVLMTQTGLPGLLVPFLLAMMLKITQGSSLVTMFTTPAIVAPVLPSLGISPEIAVLSTCAGALAVVHVNDSFFWVVTRFAGLDVSAGYRSLTILTLWQGLLALAMTWGLSLVF